jgi:NAD(P)-dependent dehydrogenase (short-subunit alcohol dehydrogenase family)
MTHNPLNLTGRNVLVTGASSGLGLATAGLLARLGAKVCLLGRHAGRLQTALDGLEGTGHQSLCFDLNDSDKLPDLLANLVSSFGPLAGLVHSAGLLQTKPLQVSRAADFEALYRVNVVAAAQLLRGLTCRGVAAPQGCAVVIVGSVLSCVGAAGKAAYGASKAAVLGLVRCAALELARYKIRVNAVLPGSFASAMTEQDFKQLTPEQVRDIEKMHPLGLGSAADVSQAVAFLVADTSRWITGASLTVDGGYTAQ